MMGLRRDVLFHNTVDIWISYSEAYNLDWSNIHEYIDFINYLKSLKIKMSPMNLCIKETGGMYKRGKKKADFLDALSKMGKERPVFIVKLDDFLDSKIREYFSKKASK